MGSCIIHVDGSFYPTPGSNKKAGLGWGLVAEHNDQTHEDCGGYAVRKTDGLNGAHEDIALLHALAYMRSHGFLPQNTSIYCDDELMGHAPTYLAKENYRPRLAEQVEQRIKRAATFIEQEDLVPQIMAELSTIRMHKVKGHQGHVYQERVDYLAKWSAHRAVGRKDSQCSFERWLQKGFVFYDAPEPDATKHLVALGLLDPVPTPSTKAPRELTQALPSARIQYAPFVRTLSTPETLQDVVAPSP